MQSSSSLESFLKVLKSFEIGMLVTHDSGHGLHGRPMAIADVEDQGNVWFITSDDTAKIDEIAQDASVLVVCQEGWTSSLTLSGRATLHRDRAKIREIWKPSYKVWFPDGVDDPKITLIRVEGERGEYWDNSGFNRLVYFYETIKAFVTGKEAEVKEGVQHDKVTL